MDVPRETSGKHEKTRAKHSIVQEVRKFLVYHFAACRLILSLTDRKELPIVVKLMSVKHIIGSASCDQGPYVVCGLCGCGSACE